MKLLILTILLLTPSAILADQPRINFEFTSQNDKYEFQIVDKEFGKEEWTLIEKSTKKELYRIKDHFWSKTVLVSNDGKSLVAVDDYSQQDFDTNPEILTFYNSGKKTKGYLLNELLNNPTVVSVSASHFRWSDFYEETNLIVNSKFSLKTYELNHFTFDIETGKILKKERDKLLSEGAIYAIGEVKELSPNKYELVVKCLIFGVVPKDGKIKFTADKNFEDYPPVPLIIKDEKIVVSKGMILNACSSK